MIKEASNLSTFNFNESLRIRVICYSGNFCLVIHVETSRKFDFGMFL